LDSRASRGVHSRARKFYQSLSDELGVYASPLGWLNAPQDGRDNKSRYDDFGDSHPICKLPEADPLLVSHFRKVGPCMGQGMGAFPVTWQELKAYSDMSGSNLTAWEADQVMMMSQLYCSYLNIGKKPCKPPYEREFDDEDIQNMNESIGKILEAEEKVFKKLKA